MHQRMPVNIFGDEPAQWGYSLHDAIQNLGAVEYQAGNTSNATADLVSYFCTGPELL